jgi:hypothetical protein
LEALIYFLRPDGVHWSFAKPLEQSFHLTQGITPKSSLAGRTIVAEPDRSAAMRARGLLFHLLRETAAST